MSSSVYFYSFWSTACVSAWRRVFRQKHVTDILTWRPTESSLNFHRFSQWNISSRPHEQNQRVKPASSYSGSAWPLKLFHTADPSSVNSVMTSLFPKRLPGPVRLHLNSASCDSRRTGQSHWSWGRVLSVIDMYVWNINQTESCLNSTFLFQTSRFMIPPGFKEKGTFLTDSWNHEQLLSFIIL